ncbi:hypothetical protein B5P45_03595 [Phyllobacterium zundukense]|uniref:Uncharacterized protein n=1 Tax=Phyllobacterium zundukense TaxID=1867719 RepID=A0A2N9W384_9HYPH|nr:hypothetical protein BLM14_21980 [Phyllobacterium zundukense]PIO46202.1 hypothetical protein B5P45_03595 [Phyllobacterium zundukense]
MSRKHDGRCEMQGAIIVLSLKVSAASTQGGPKGALGKSLKVDDGPRGDKLLRSSSLDLSRSLNRFLRTLVPG